jgi:hypothetical protein
MTSNSPPPSSTTPPTPPAEQTSIVKQILLFVLSVNWFLGALAIAIALRRMQSDYKLLVMTFIFGIFGYATYVND